MIREKVILPILMGLLMMGAGLACVAFVVGAVYLIVVITPVWLVATVFVLGMAWWFGWTEMKT